MSSAHPQTDLTIPITQRAAIVEKSGGPVKIVERPVVQACELKTGEVLVKILYSGVCHTDIHIAQGALGELQFQPLIGGHEGTGGWGELDFQKLSILRGVFARNEAMCPDIKCSGFTVGGTFQQYVVGHATHVTPIPELLPLHSAAPILCAGLAVYAALKQSNTEPGDIVVITGAGGGLGHLAIQYAINAFDLRVIAVDTGENKKELCLKLGAEAFVDFKATEDVKQAADGVGAHAVLVTSTPANAYEGVLEYLRPQGTLLGLGVATGCTLNLDMIYAVSRCITVKGLVTGNRHTLRQALDIAARGRVHTTYRIEPLAKLPEIFEELEAGKLAGRVVLDLVSLKKFIAFQR